MLKPGKKAKKWQKAKKDLVKEALANERITLIDGVPHGVCEDCRKWKILQLDHIKKRSQGGKHTYENIDWVCNECHDLRDNRGDPMGKKKKSNKAKWEEEHKCQSCGAMVSVLICPHCSKLSVKSK